MLKYLEDQAASPVFIDWDNKYRLLGVLARLCGED